MSKGSRPRPFSVTLNKFSDNWDKIFGKPKGTCGCGRSPTGDCIGWHGLTEAGYKAALDQYNKENKQ
jgi:hypothetical protein